MPLHVPLISKESEMFQEKEDGDVRNQVIHLYFHTKHGDVGNNNKNVRQRADSKH